MITKTTLSHGLRISLPVMSSRMVWIWLMLGFFWLSPFILYAAHLSNVTNYLFPLLALIVGAILIFKQPTLYLSHVWWLWMLTPEIRRLVDYQIGWQPVDPIMLSPYLATALTALTVISNIQLLNKKYLFPFALSAAGVFYGYMIGIADSGLFPATFALLNWLLPILFGLHIAYRWRDYERNKSTIMHTFIAATLAMGLYGIFQFIDPPAWDKLWMINSKMLTIGQPLPFEVRVFSTMNSPTPFAFEIMGTLLLLLIAKGFWRIPATVTGYIALLLSLVRAAWGGWVIGFLYILYRSKPKYFVKFMFGLILVFLLALPLLTYGPIAKDVSTRYNSIVNLQKNYSYQSRKDFYERFMIGSITSPLGIGLGSLGVATRLSAKGYPSDFDSGIMEVPFTLGWLGGGLYFLGVIWSLFFITLNNCTKSDPFIIAAAAIALAIFSTMIFTNSLIGSSGVLFWGFCGMAISGIVYNKKYRKK